MKTLVILKLHEGTALIWKRKIPRQHHTQNEKVLPLNNADGCEDAMPYKTLFHLESTLMTKTLK